MQRRFAKPIQDGQLPWAGKIDPNPVFICGALGGGLVRCHWCVGRVDHSRSGIYYLGQGGVFRIDDEVGADEPEVLLEMIIGALASFVKQQGLEGDIHDFGNHATDYGQASIQGP